MSRLALANATAFEYRLNYPYLPPTKTGIMINPPWHELHMYRTNFIGYQDVRAIEVRLDHGRTGRSTLNPCHAKPGYTQPLQSV